ncbi:MULTISPECIES: hypothetical protein [unclassified Microcoleus]|uniref:hypothetical protein n=1 Tax=unclassified Microcoleus TaxID=2642155 RepID=UPI002FCF4946
MLYLSSCPPWRGSNFFLRSYWLLVIGYWLLVIGYWLLVISYWLLVIGYWLLVIGYWLLVSRGGGWCVHALLPSLVISH